MGQAVAKFQLIWEDIKTSWYFRIYAITWLLFAVTTFSSLIILGQRATAGQSRGIWSLWIENAATGLTFPPFTVRLADDEQQNIIDSVVCRGSDGYLNLVPTEPCPDGSPYPSKCVYVQADHASAATPTDNGFDCYFNVTAPASNMQDKILLIQINETNSFGPSTLYVNPNSNAWVSIGKTGVNDGSSAQENFIYHLSLTYRTTVIQGDFFNVHFAYDSFSVFHWFKSMGYDTWLSVGGIGGFAFFMVILHTAFMWLIGLCLTNDSKFLIHNEHESSSSSSYQNIKE